MQTYINCYYGETLDILKTVYVDEIRKQVTILSTVPWCSGGHDKDKCAVCDLWTPKLDSPLTIIKPESEESDDLESLPDQDFTELNFD